jgi:hypothetical protein
VLLCLVALGPAAQAAPVHRDTGSSGIGIQLMEGPANRKKDPRAHRYIVDHLAPGTTVRRKLKVINNSAEARRVELYPAAAGIEKASFVFGAHRKVNELTTWITLDQVELNLAPGAAAVVEATVAVPPAASAGERFGVIWAAAGSPSPASGGIRQVTRTGVRVYLDIGLGGEPHSDFIINQLTPARSAAGDPSLVVSLTNTGGRALDMSGTANLSDGPASQRAGPFSVSSTTTLAPDETGTVVVAFPRALPNGPWKVDLTLESGLVNRQVTALITFPDPGRTGKPGTIMSRLSGPWILGGGSLMTGLLLVALVLLIRRNRRSRTSA